LLYQFSNVVNKGEGNGMSRITKAELIVENWNLRYPVGTIVTVKKDDGSTLTTTTRFPAEVSASGHAVGWFTGISGYYLLDRATPIAKAEGRQ
jgi:hypothetical protein